MKSVLPRKRTLRVLTIVGALILFFGVAYAGARHIAWPWFKTWREDRANNIAREYLAKGDLPNALVAVRKTLEYNQRNIEAWKLAVQITEKQDSPHAIFYQQRLAAAEPTLENQLKHLRLAVKHRAYANALDAITKATGPDIAKSPEFFELAALVAQRTGNLSKAKYFLMSLVELQPANNKARLDLAQIRLVDGYEENKPAIRSELNSLASDPALRTRALSLLLADAIDNKSAAASLQYAEQLALAPAAPIVTRLLVAEAFRAYAPERAGPWLDTLKKTAATPDAIIPVANFLNTHDQAAETRRWLDTLPDELRATESIQVAYAHALHALKDLPALENYLRPLKWTGNEFIRQSYLAYATRRRGDLRASSDAWKLALIEAGSDERKLQYLLAQTGAWDWNDQKYEVLWKRFTANPADKNTRNQIATYELSKASTVNLNRLYARIAEYDPSDRDARNNYNYTSLLLNVNLDRAQRDAYELHKAEPANSFFTTTYALSLYKQNKPREALDTLDTLGIAAIATPARALIRSVLLIANARIDEGLDQSAHIDLARVLPEERLLHAETAAIIAKARRDQAGIARLAAMTAAAGANAAGRKSWLAALPAAYREKNNVQMEIADNLYSNDEYNGLSDALSTDSWAENDFLRHALLSYAQRNLRRDSAARDTWRLAVTTAGLGTGNLLALAGLCERWGWTIERVEIQNRIIQRDPADRKNFAELADYYLKNGQTVELARIYTLRVDSEAADTDSKIRLAYYSLLTDTNTSRAHTLAKEAYDAAPANPDAVKVYAFSLLKQSRIADGWRVIAALPDRTETGYAQLSLLKAALAARQNDAQQARAQLASFDGKTALPEEIALADTLNRTLAQTST